jgi:hypothetical protein
MRVEWLKPIMFTAGVGWLEDQQVHKLPPAEGMLVCKMGGPAYRIGKEWASSMSVVFAGNGTFTIAPCRDGRRSGKQSCADFRFYYRRHAECAL